MKTIDVIIPHYNSPKLLERLLDSIPVFDNLHIIIVDDNSSCDIVNFSSFPGSQRPDTEIIFLKENQYAGNARNIGLEHASGEWLLFADSDDFFMPDVWECISDGTESNADIVYFGLTSMDSQTLQTTDRHRTYSQYLERYLDNPTQENENLLRFRHDVPWGKLIRRSLVTTHHISFDKTRYCNDTIFSCKCALTASKIKVIPNITYCVTIQSGSLTTHVSAFAIETRFSVIVRKNKLLRTAGYKQYQMPVLFYLRQAWGVSPQTFFRMILIGQQYGCQWGKEIIRWIKNNH